MPTFRLNSLNLESCSVDFSKDPRYSYLGGSIGVKLIENKPYKHNIGDCPWQWWASLPRSKKPKVVIMVTHLAKKRFIFQSCLRTFFIFSLDLYWTEFRPSFSFWYCSTIKKNPIKQCEFIDENPHSESFYFSACRMRWDSEFTVLWISIDNRRGSPLFG